jgi:hypothetical protein
MNACSKWKSVFWRTLKGTYIRCVVLIIVLELFVVEVPVTGNAILLLVIRVFGGGFVEL